MSHGIFITGTDTGIGKTLVSAWLVRGWGAAYWKPIQSGVEERDSESVVALAAVPPHRILPSAYELTQPLSPHEAARRDSLQIDLSLIRLPDHTGPLVVEGAGGVLVPLNDTTLMVDLMRQLGLPVLVVARSGLGTINHTLLALEALRSRGLQVAGVVLNGPPHDHNGASIEHYGRVRVLAHLPPLETVNAAALAALAPPPSLESLT